MSECRKRVLSPLTGRRKRKAWKTRETHIPLKEDKTQPKHLILQRGMDR